MVTTREVQWPRLFVAVVQFAWAAVVIVMTVAAVAGAPPGSPAARLELADWLWLAVAGLLLIVSVGLLFRARWARGLGLVVTCVLAALSIAAIAGEITSGRADISTRRSLTALLALTLYQLFAATLLLFASTSKAPAASTFQRQRPEANPTHAV